MYLLIIEIFQKVSLALVQFNIVLYAVELFQKSYIMEKMRTIALLTRQKD